MKIIRCCFPVNTISVIVLVFLVLITGYLSAADFPERDVIGPFEEMILNVYGLESQHRIITPVINQDLAFALECVDRDSGNGDGYTSVTELREHLSFVSAWTPDYFHDKYTDEILPGYEDEIESLRDEFELDLFNPFGDELSILSDYALAALAYDFLYWHNEEYISEKIINSSVPDKELFLSRMLDFKAILKGHAGSGPSELIALYQPELISAAEVILLILSDTEIIEEINILLKSKQYLGVIYANSDYKKNQGYFGIQSPIEIFLGKRGERNGTCSELSILGWVIARAFNFPVKVVAMEYLIQETQTDILYNETVNGVMLKKHMALLFELEDENIYLDPSCSTKYQTIDHIRAMDYQEQFSQALYEYNELDDLNLIRTYFRDAAGWLIYYDTEEYLPWYNSLFQASYIVDPVNEDDDFFNLYFGIKQRAEALAGAYRLHPTFKDIYGQDRPDNFRYLAENYFILNPYNLKFATDYFSISGDVIFIDMYLEALMNLSPITIADKQYFIEE